MLSEQTWRELRGRLRGFVARRVGEDDADDVVQEVFLRIYRGIDSLHQGGRLEAWAHQITRNAIADHFRSRGRRHEDLADDEDLERAAERGSTLTGEADVVDETACDPGLASCLAPLVAQLAEPYRQAVDMVEMGGLDQADAAARVGISTSGMKSRVQRARRQLRAMLLECCRVELDRRGGVLDYRPHGGECDGCGGGGGMPCCDN